MLTKVFQYSLIFNKQFMIPIVALGMCLVGKNAYLGICRLGKMPPWECATWENAYLGKCRLGKMPPWEVATWEVAVVECAGGKVPGAKCPRTFYATKINCILFYLQHLITHKKVR